jgi:sterol desaturase/sphingolipid hydroxylase (fatty acid hydroxylase superfamily)
VLESLIARLNDYFLLFSAAIFLGLAVLETLRPLRPATGPLVWRWVANIGLYFVNILLFAFILTDHRVLALLGASGDAVDGPIAALGRFAGEWPLLICGFLASDLFLYVAHRLEHGIFILWRMHVVHHSDGELDASTGLRHYPLEAALHALVGTTMFLALGIPPWVGAAYGMVGYVVGVTQHANLRVLPPAVDRALQWVIVTPEMHRIHHSVRRTEHDSNYGNVLSIWDHMFRTYRSMPMEHRDAMIFGIAGLTDTAEARPDCVLLQPFRLAAATRSAPPQRSRTA